VVFAHGIPRGVIVAHAERRRTLLSRKSGDLPRRVRPFGDFGHGGLRAFGLGLGSRDIGRNVALSALGTIPARLLEAAFRPQPARRFVAGDAKRAANVG